MSKVATHTHANHAQTRLQQALALHQRGQLAQARALYEDILRTLPNQFNILHLLGIIALQTRHFQQAVGLFDKAISLNPDFAEAHSNRGIALKELNQPEAAVASFDKAISLKPDYAEAYANRGNVLKDLDQLDAAVISFDKAITLKPDYAEAYYNRGKALIELRQPDAAAASFEQAITLKPDFAAAYSSRGNVLKVLQQYDAAIASFNRAIAVKPDYAEAYANRGHVLRDLMQLDAALASYDRAIALKPDFVEAYSNRGNVLKDLCQVDAALASYDRAIALKPDYADAYWNKSLALLLKGDFENGWELYEWRWRTDFFTPYKRNFQQPVWSGREPLAGKTILLHSEQGLGDTIQFGRYASLVANLGAQVIMEVGKPLLGLFKGLAGISRLIEKGDPLPAFDFHCPLLSLPRAFRTGLDTIPCQQKYLDIDPARLACWRSRLGEKNSPRIGLVWGGSATNTNDHNRSIPLSTVLQQLPGNFHYVSLQKDLRDSDESLLDSQPNILNFGHELDDFTDTAALCELMDVVISVDTSVAHLSGALGKPTWLLLPFSPDWRWLMDRDDSPWYPSMKVYRQKTPGDWGPVFARIKAELALLYGQASATLTGV